MPKKLKKFYIFFPTKTTPFCDTSPLPVIVRTICNACLPTISCFLNYVRLNLLWNCSGVIPFSLRKDRAMCLSLGYPKPIAICDTDKFVSNSIRQTHSVRACLISSCTDFLNTSRKWRSKTRRDTATASTTSETPIACVE